MRRLLLAIFVPLLCAVPPPLQIVQPIISQSDGGVADTPGTQHVPGEVLFFTCRIANYTKTPEEKIHIAYSVEAFDPKGVPLVEVYKNELSDEVSPQDKDWMPRIATEIAIPPLVGSGAYKIVVKAEDLVAKTSAELSVPFEVRGHAIESSDTLVVRNFHLYRDENAVAPLQKPVFRPGGAIWAKFDITGFKYGPANKIDVSYVYSVLSGTGKVLFTQPEPAGEQVESFYPKRYITGEFSVNLDPKVKPGEYGLSIEVRDGIGNQKQEMKLPFTVE